MSQTDQYRKRDRYIRSYETHRTDVDLSMADYEENWEPVTYRALEKIHIIVPAQYTFTIHPNKRHVSLHRPEKRHVQESLESNIATYHESRNEASNRSSRWQRETQERETQLTGRQQLLEKELEAAEEKEIQERIGVRERRPYARGALSDQASTIIPKDASRPVLTRRVTFVEQQPASPTQIRHQHYDDKDSRRRSGLCPRKEPVCQEASSRHESQRYHIEEVYPPTDDRTGDRRPPRQVVRRYRYYKSVPLLFQRIIIGGRRESRKVDENPPRSKHLRSLDIRYESRTPDDYV